MSVKPTWDWSNIGELNVGRRIPRPCLSHVTADDRKRTHAHPHAHTHTLTCTHTLTHAQPHAHTHTRPTRTHTHPCTHALTLTHTSTALSTIRFLSPPTSISFQRSSSSSRLKPIHLILVPSPLKTTFISTVPATFMVLLDPTHKLA